MMNSKMKREYRQKLIKQLEQDCSYMRLMNEDKAMEIFNYVQILEEKENNYNDLNQNNAMSMQLGQEVLQLIKKINENKDQEEIKYINRSKQVYESNEQELQRLAILYNEMNQLNQTLESKQQQDQHQLQQLQNQQSQLDHYQLKNQQNSLKIQKLNQTLESTNQLLRKYESTKRTLNNQLQEEKGNIRVYCRVRPLLNHETDNIVQVSGDTSLILTVPQQYLKSDNTLKTHSFHFEYVFPETACQNQIYNEIQQLIDNVIDGNNVCIFAYGQTGSGKTYTMQGSDSQKGVIPNAVSNIFHEISNLNSLGWKFIIKVGFQEIYNETIKDLLTNIKCDEVKMVTVQDEQTVGLLFQKAMENRKVAETQCNEMSSRSHFIFQLNLQGNNDKQLLNSTLSLIDLAGSERCNQAKTEGERFGETKYINKSLSSLSDVIHALAKKSQHVPFRNSKLTHTLQKYLEGNSKTLMLVNVSPKGEDYQQTLYSLKFADKVKNTKLQQQKK